MELAVLIFPICFLLVSQTMELYRVRDRTETRKHARRRSKRQQQKKKQGGEEGRTENDDGAEDSHLQAEITATDWLEHYTYSRSSGKVCGVVFYAKGVRAVAALANNGLEVVNIFYKKLGCSSRDKAVVERAVILKRRR